MKFMRILKGKGRKITKDIGMIHLRARADRSSTLNTTVRCFCTLMYCLLFINAVFCCSCLSDIFVVNIGVAHVCQPV